MNRKRLKVAAVALLLLLGLWAAWMLLFPNPHLARARELQKQLGDRNLSPDQRRGLFRELRQEVGRLSPRQRAELGRGRRQAMNERLKKYFALSAKDRRNFLDNEIKRMQSMRRQWQQSRGNAGNGPGGAGWGGRGGGQNRLERRLQFLDNTTPEERAQWSQFRQEMRTRMQQLGVSWGGPRR